MTPRKVTQNDAGPQRLPYAAAEALLWGPEMKKQHTWLLAEMRALQTQHKIYDTRIQNTEVAAEAAEAATSRIRHLEQQLAAIEAVDSEKVFEKWASAEINQLKVFRDDNKHVRQRQIDLEKDRADVGDEFEAIKHVPGALKSLVRRVDILEACRKEDFDRLQYLERENASLKIFQQTFTMNRSCSLPNVERKPSSLRARTPPRQFNSREVDDATETEDEDDIRGLGHNSITEPVGETVQAHRNLEIGNSETGSALSAKQSILSARQRLLKRPSIHDSKFPRMHKGIPREVMIPPQEDRSCRVGSPPATQLIRKTRTNEPAQPVLPHASSPPATQVTTRVDVRKRKQPVDTVHTTRVTRSQAQNLEGSSEPPRAPAPSIKTRGRPTPTTIKHSGKLERPSAVQVPRPASSNIVATEATQPAPTNPNKRLKLSAAAGPSKRVYVASVIQRTPVSPTKQKELIVVLPTRSPDRQIRDSVYNHPQPPAAGGVKVPAKKAVPHGRPCKSCSKRHRACDRARPACGECVRRSQPHACVYEQTLSSDAHFNASDVASSRKKERKTQPTAPISAGASGISRSVDVAETNTRSSSRTLSPGKPTLPVYISSITLPPVSASPAPNRSRRRMVPDIDYETFMKMKEKDPRF